VAREHASELMRGDTSLVARDWKMLAHDGAFSR
jgi:hypothetical protein